MNARVTATTFALLLSGIHWANSASAIPAWQEPGFVMEEVIATAPRTSTKTTPAWEQPGYVMEEVIVTAPGIDPDDLRAAIRERLLSKPFAGNVAPLARPGRTLIRHAGQFDAKLDLLSVAP